MIVRYFILMISQKYEFIIQSNGMSRVNQTTLPQNQELKKIFCAYHPSEFLTNFCCDSECLMPLCPSCIVEHTQQHFLQNNKPIYVNLQEIISQTKQKCYQHILVFEELSRDNDSIFDYLMSLRESIHNQLMEDKEEVVERINHIFEVYEDKIYADALAKYKEMEVYNKKETIAISQFINEQIQALHDQIAILKGENCLAGLITYFSNDGQIYENSIKELLDYAAKHKLAGKVFTNNDFQKLEKEFQNFCENVISIEYINEVASKQKDESQLEESRASRFGKSLMGRLNKKTQGQNISKENILNHSNKDPKTQQKKIDQFYKIDQNEGKTSRMQYKLNTSSRSHLIQSHN